MKKPKRKSSLAGIYSKLANANVEFASNSDAGKMTPEQVRGMICNPVYAGIGASYGKKTLNEASLRDQAAR
jgi:hypothetical protein